MKDLKDIISRWEELITNVTVFYNLDRPGKAFDYVPFQEIVSDTYEYFENTTNCRDTGQGRLLSAEESDLLAKVYAYGRMEEFNGVLTADDYCLASHFIALGLYDEITRGALGRNSEQPYTLTADFRYCGADEETYQFEYNVKDRDMTDILNLIKLFKKSGWPKEKYMLCYPCTRSYTNMVKIYSRKEMERILQAGFPEDTAVISFYNPPGTGSARPPVNYVGKAERVFQLSLDDFQSSIPEANDLARFIEEAVWDELNIICQCESGQSRSAGCAAAILEFYDQSGQSIFDDDRYFPDEMVYYSVLDALEMREKKRTKKD